MKIKLFLMPVFFFLIVNIIFAADFSFNLEQGWNLISLPYVPTNKSVKSVFSSVDGNYTSVFAYNSSDVGDEWKSYDPNRPEFLNTLKEVDDTMGIWIKAKNKSLLRNNGSNTELIFIMRQGWNLIGYPATQIKSIQYVMEDVSAEYSSVFMYNASDLGNEWKSYDPARPDFLNTLKNFTPGYGFWIRAKNDTNWTFENGKYKKCANGICRNQQFDPDCKIMKSDSNVTLNHVNMVFVPSNFSGNMTLFAQKAQWIWSKFNEFVPYNNSITKLNAFYVTKENDSINCFFNCSGIDRLLCCDTVVAKKLSETCTNGSRQTIVIHNNDKYGGAGYTSADVATTSTNQSAPYIAVHETGHSLFNLGDEYNAFSTPDNSRNCDVITCPRWADIIGYKGVNCGGSSCKDNAYFASEITIMRQLDKKFEEVNERLSCCIYHQETNTLPAYCDQYMSLGKGLYQYCLDEIGENISDNGTAPVVFEYVFEKDSSGNWKLSTVVEKTKGKYPDYKTKGDGKGQIKVTILNKNKKIKNFLFEETVDVEFVEQMNVLGGYAKVPRNELSMIIEEELSEVDEISINGRVIYKNGFQKI